MESCRVHNLVELKSVTRGARTLLFVTDSAAYGGTEKHLLDLLDRLDPARARVAILCINADPYTERLGHRAPGVRMMKAEKRPTTVAEWSRLFRKVRPDTLVFVHGAVWCFPCAAYVAAWLAGVPRIYSVQHLAPEPLPPKVPIRSAGDIARRLFGWRTRLVLGFRLSALLTDRTICVSNRVRTDLVRNYGHSAETAVAIPNGVDVSAFGPSETNRAAVRRRLGIGPDEVVFLSVARLVPVKGLDVLLAGLGRLTDGRFKCVIVGDGPLRERLVKQASTLGLSSCVLFEGFQQDVRQYLQAADVFVLTSHMEGLPLAILEAMACGLPCVVTDVGGNAEAVGHGQEGLVVKPGAVDDVAEALAYMLNNEQERLRMARCARAKVHRAFNLDVQMGEVARALLN